MSLTINTVLNGTLGLQASDNPVTITSSGGVVASATGADAIDGASGVNWSIQNSGNIQSSSGFGVYLLGLATIVNSSTISGNAGIRLGAGGTITNNAGGSIKGTGVSGTVLADTSGVYIDGGTGTVSNGGNIQGAGYGVGLGGGGSVNNTGTVSGGEDGVFVIGGIGNVQNSGSISASIDDGVGLFNGGSVTNLAGGSITGLVGTNAAGVFTIGAAATVDNSGQIAGRQYGILVAAGGTVTNNQNATITGQTAGVSLSHGGTLNNSGSIKATGANSAGADLELGGSVTNYSGGLVSGVYGVFMTGASGTVVNSGQISASTYYGVSLGRGGSVTNNQGGSIQGVHAGVNLSNQSATVTNSGTISASAGDSAGVMFNAGGQVANNSGGAISGVGYGIFASGASVAITNAGQLSGLHGVGLVAGGTVNNLAGGSIAGQTAGVFVTGAAAAVTNAGGISASSSGGAGVDIEAGGSVVNNAGDAISGGWGGVFITGGAGTVTNAGTITGGSYAVDFSTYSSANLLVDDPGSVFNGLVNGNGGTLELASGGAGSLSGLGTTQFDSFQALQIDSAANWTLSGAGNVIANLNDNGALAVAGTLDVSGSINASSTGAIALGSGDVLEVAKAIGSNSQIDFKHSGELILDNAALFGTGVGSSSYHGDLLENFATGSSVDIHNFSLAGASLGYDSTTGLLQISNGAAQTATLDFQSSTLSSGNFAIASDGSSGVLITRA
jgi:hypothetical protein